jgi:hypothetical protein
MVPRLHLVAPSNAGSNTVRWWQLYWHATGMVAALPYMFVRSDAPYPLPVANGVACSWRRLLALAFPQH